MVKQFSLIAIVMFFVCVINPLQSMGADGLKVGIASVEINSELKPVVTYVLTDDSGNPLSPTTNLSTIRFILTHLVTDNATNDLAHYESYTVNSTTGQATYDSGGKHVSLGGNRWQYTFAKALPTGFDMGATHLLSAQISRTVGENIYHANPVFYFVPNGSPVTKKRELSSTETCNQCHNGLGLHGGGRREFVLCITCHNPQSVDPDTGNTVDMKVMIHKIHMGEELPSVQAGTPYQIIGFGNSVHDYSTVVFPQDIRNCVSCHTGDQSDRWKTAPSRAACGSCHDNIDFAAGTGHAKMSNDNLCSFCHTSEGTELSIADAHMIPSKSPTLRGLVAEIKDVKNAAPGQPIEVHFSLKNADDNSVINVASMDRLRLMFAGPTSDYKAYTQETVAATNSVLIGDVYVYTFTKPLPSDAAGSFAVGIEGRRKVSVGDEVINETLLNKVSYFSVDGSTVVPRRKVVDIALCNNCHGKLEFHGGTRNDAEYCVICHNPGLSSRAPSVTIQFKTMIHLIHTGEAMKETGTEYKIGNADFSEIRFPGDRKQCNICHVGESYEVPLPNGVLPTTVTQSGTVISTTSPTQAACLTCHTGSEAAAHAQVNTTPNGGESCSVCHAEGRIASLDEAHALRVFLEPQIPVEPETAIVNWMLNN